MMLVEPKSILKRLTRACTMALEAAIGQCVNARHYEVTLEHIMLALLDNADSDMAFLASHYDLDPGRLRSVLQRSLEDLRTGRLTWDSEAFLRGCPITPRPEPLPPAKGLSARKPKPVQLQEPSPIVSPEPKPAAPGDPQTAVAEAPPEPKAGKAGILAFKDKLASLAQDRSAPRLGKDAKYTTAENSNQSSSPSMLTSNSPGKSGGVDFATLSRRRGGSAGGT